MTSKLKSTVRCLSILMLATFLVACVDSDSDPVTAGSTTANNLIDQDATTTAEPASDGTTSGTDVVTDDGSVPNTTDATATDTITQPAQTDGTVGDTNNGVDNAEPIDDGNTETNAPVTDNPDNVTPNPVTPVTDNPDAVNPDTETPNQDQPITEGPEQPVNNPNPTSPSIVATPSATGSDQSGNDDDSPTETESASIAGPFIKDASRAAGPPSVPEGLTLLMSGEDFLEFSWKPSTDDQSVESYEIYRDGTLVYTIEHDNTFEHSYRNWISTSYIDCNYTRFTHCGANPIVPGSSYQYQVAAIDNEGMKSALSAPVTFQLAQRQSGSPDLSSYSLVLNEEFDGESLDREVWKTSLPWGEDTIINGERQYFVNLFGSDPIDANPFVFTGSSLQIKGTVTPPELLEAANQQPYLSGVISTKDKFQMTYGYVEMNAKLTGGQGFLSTFYLFNQDFFKNKPEIDIIEYIGDRPDKAYQTYHYHDSNRARSADGERHSTPTMESVMGFDLSSGFHKYSVLWEPELVVWYIDGVEVRRLTGVRISDEPMNIIAQLVVGSIWIGEPDPASLPKVLEIDYIKAWQKQ